MGRVQGKVAFITGAARGQGRAHAVRLAEEGADIIGIDLCEQIASVPYAMSTEADLEETRRQVEALDRRMVVRQADVRDPLGLKSALDAGIAELGRLDIVVANAGIWSYSSASSMTSETWQDMIDVNLTGVWNTCQAAVSALIEAGGGGSMILISSTAGLRGGGNIAHYSAAKHGVVGIMRSLAAELAPHSIRVNCIHPTSVGTDMIFNEPMYQLFRPDLETPSLEDALTTLNALNMLPVPWVDSIDISNAVLFLASDESRYVTSISLPVDAGSAQRWAG